MAEAESAGVTLKKQWLSTIDDRTRDTHADLDGVTIDLDEPFEVDGDTGDAPGQFSDPANNINCRCTMISVVEGFEPKQRRVRDEGIVNYATFDEWKNNL
jgi:uncharacterized protein with gpF-like domain